MEQYYKEIATDYQKSVIGAFTEKVLEAINSDKNLCKILEVYMTVTKFDQDCGYSLVHQENQANSSLLGLFIE